MIEKTIAGDALEHFATGLYTGLIHGCNCFHIMGGGIAAQIRHKYPQAYMADLDTLSGDAGKLGTYSKAIVPGSGVILNAYTQYDISSNNEVAVEYTALYDAFRKINDDYAGGTFVIPMIGAGLANGDWDIISSQINEATPDITIHVAVL